MISKQQNKSLKSDLLLITGSIIFITVILFFLYSFIRIKEKIRDYTQEQIMIEAKEAALKFTTEFEKDLSISETLAQTLSTIKNEEIKFDIERDAQNSILFSILTSNKKVIAAFSLWERNTFDDNDESYSGTPGHDKNGQFMPLLSTSESGQILIETIMHKGVMGVGDFYNIPKKTKESVITDPIDYPIQNKSENVVFFSSPIIYKYNFLGVAGILIKTRHFQGLLRDERFFNGEAKISLFSNNGAYVATNQSDSLVGLNIKNIQRNYFQQLTEIQKGTEEIEIDRESIKILLPLYLGNQNTPWQLFFEIPVSYIELKIANEVRNLLIISILMLSISLFLLFYFFNRLLKPIDNINEAIKKINNGHLDIEIKYQKDNELGLLIKNISDIAKSLKEVTLVSQAISNGDFSKSVAVKSENDTLGISINKMNKSLQDTLKENERQKQEVKLQNWSSEGLALLGEALRSSTNLETLSYNIIQNLIERLGAALAGLYLYNDNDVDHPYLELTAAIAFDRKKHLNQRIYTGEGLIGTCALEKEIIFMTKIPDDYIKISSGIGSSVPRSLLLVPLKIEKKILGVIEIASLNLFSQHEIQFIEKASESIALTISNVEINEKTSVLLEQTKKQTEELTSKEQLLRRNLEELKLFQEESEKKEEEYYSFISALNNSLIILTLNLDGEILNANQLASEFLQITEDEIIGRNYGDLESIVTKPDFITIIREIINGNNFIAEKLLMKINNKDIQTKHIIAPVLNKMGIPQKILLFITEISNN